MTPNEFAKYWAIQLPDGTLWEAPDQRMQIARAKAALEAWEKTPEQMRGVAGIPADPPEIPEPIAGVFHTEESAQEVCAQLREQAAIVGVTHWAGQVVSAMRTPFATSDPGEQFADDIATWMAVEHPGGAQ